MKLTTILVASLTTISTVTASNWFTGGKSIHVNDEEAFPVPGDNPLFFCQDPKDYGLEIENVGLSPNPPSAGKTLSIKANGTLTRAVSEGSKVHVQVKYGLIRILNIELDLCNYVGEVGEKCPLEKGDLNLKKDVDLPKEIPNGKYTVLADVTDQDEKKVTCLTATVVFKKDDDDDGDKGAVVEGMVEDL